MNNIWNLKYFLIFLLIFFLLMIMLLILLKSAKGSSNRKIVGYFKDFKTNEIIALSLIITNFVYLAFNLIMKMDISLPIISISIGLILIATTLSLNIKNIVINNLFNLINTFVLYIGGKVNIIRLNSDDRIFYYLQILINFLGLIFFIFSSLKFCKDLSQKEGKRAKTK